MAAGQSGGKPLEQRDKLVCKGDADYCDGGTGYF